jgi:predicted MFS family arabinose efflux permease
VASLIGDHYPAEKRASVTAIIWLGAPLGAIGGSVIGGWLAQTYGWRMWFFVIAVPALLLAFAAFVTLRDPPRGLSDGRALSATPPSMSAVIRFLWAKQSFRQILIGAGLAAISLNALGQFFARYFVANFHVGLADAGRILGLMAGTAMASGLLLGGFGVDRLAKIDRRWYVRAPALGLLAAAPLFIAGALQPTLAAAVVVLLLGHIALFVFWTPTLALAQNMVGADMRASSAFVVNIVLGLVGIGLGPTLIGILSDLFAHSAFALGNFAQMCPAGAPPSNANAALAAACRAASAEGVRNAIVVMSLLFAWAGAHYLLASRDLERDLDTHYAA